MNEPQLRGKVGDYEVRVLKVMVAMPGEAIFSEFATTVEIVDEAAGEYVKVSQVKYVNDEQSHYIHFSTDEWPAIKSAVDFMVNECRKDKG